MIRGKVIVPSFCLLAVVFLPMPAEAVSGFNVQINGTPVTIPAGATEVDISGTYGCFTIAGTIGPPKVRMSEAAADDIHLENARITANSGNCNGTIEFWAVFQTPPTPSDTPAPFPPGTPATFKRSVPPGGTIRKSTGLPAVGDWLEVTGWVDANEIVVYERKTITCSSTGCENIPSLTKYEDWLHPSLPGDREIKGRSKFKLTYTGNQLTLPMFEVENPGGADVPRNVFTNDSSITIGVGESERRRCPWWKFWCCDC